jgi:hypothetical protein
MSLKIGSISLKAQMVDIIVEPDYSGGLQVGVVLPQ